MRRFKALLLLWALACFLTGCSFAGTGEGGGAALPPAPVPALEETGAADAPKETAPPAGPSKEAVAAARKEALESMPQEQVDRLTEAVKTANLWLEQIYLYDDLFGKLEDPDSLYWNYFDQSGEIQIAWAYDGNLDMDAVCVREGLTEVEFYSRYGTAVSAVSD